MAEQYSAQWWNEFALSRGNRLYLPDIEAATGGTYRNTLLRPGDFTAGFSQNWAQAVIANAPGFKDAMLALGIFQSEPIPADLSQWHWDVWPEAQYFQSQVGYVAPGSNVAEGWQPVLTETYTPPPPPPPPPTAPTPTVQQTATPAGTATLGATVTTPTPAAQSTPAPVAMATAATAATAAAPASAPAIPWAWLALAVVAFVVLGNKQR